ncbi:MAG TPA: hypothetical protein VHO50_12790 [Bacteroidales bacterium]|nr:hypothetical protein [Bacteroidales bacterium]
MNKLCLAMFTIVIAGCGKHNGITNRVPVAEVGKTVLYIDDLPRHLYNGASTEDSSILVQNYIKSWTKKKLLLMKAEENLSEDLMKEVDRQMEETRSNLLIYQYQRQMIIEKMDTLISETELENYYSSNEKAFILTSNIVKALFIKLPVETPELNNIRRLSRSNESADMHQLESYCFQFAEKFDDFNEEWITMDRLIVELHEDIENQENFLKRNTFYETTDSTSVYLVSIRDYRLRSSLAPFEYVRNDIKRIIYNQRRIDLIQGIESGIYNDALKDNTFIIY